MDVPVTLESGRARFVTRPARTGSPERDDDGDGTRCPLGHQGDDSPFGDDEFDLELYELLYQTWELGIVAIRVAPLDDQVLALGPPKCAQVVRVAISPCRSRRGAIPKPSDAS